jgi:hypothetical protein
MRPKPEIPEEIEDFRDQRWCREWMRQIERACDAERFIEQVGFAACLTDLAPSGPVALRRGVRRRDAVMPRNVQKDPEASLTWLLKDEIVKRGNVYYAKLARGKATFIAPRMIPYFHAIWGVRRPTSPAAEPHARAILKVLRKEWEMAPATCATSPASKNAQAFTKAMDELQAAMIVVPSEVLYAPKFTYIWTLGVGRFPDALRRRVSRPARSARSRAAFSPAPGMTIPASWRASPGCRAGKRAAAIAPSWPRATPRCSHRGGISCPSPRRPGRSRRVWPAARGSGPSLAF